MAESVPYGSGRDHSVFFLNGPLFLYFCLFNGSLT